MLLLDEQWAEQSLLSHLEEISEEIITLLIDAAFSLAPVYRCCLLIG